MRTMALPTYHLDDEPLQPHEVIPVLRVQSRRYRLQRQLAEALTVETGEEWTQAMVSSLERGKKHFEVTTMAAICRIFGVDAGVFVSGLTIRDMPGYLGSLEQLELLPDTQAA